MEPYHTEIYRGYRIKIIQDPDAYHLNPYDSDDGMYPMRTYGGRQFKSHDYYGVSDAVLDCITYTKYVRHKKALWSAINDSPDPNRDSYDNYTNFKDAVGVILDDGDDLEYIEEVCDLMGLPVYSGSTSGYSQGDYINALVVWTPEWGKKTGTTKERALKDDKASMKLNIEIYGAWCWGDVFGYVVERVLDGDDDDGEELDACWGFIEPDTDEDKMYVLKEARSVVDYHISQLHEKHIEQLKTWIKARVPYQYRTAMPVFE